MLRVRARPSGVPRSQSGVLRVVWWALAGAAVAGSAVWLTADHARSWWYFVDATHLFFDPGGGLDLYRDHPELQFGPLTVLLVAPFVALPDGVGEATVVVLGSVCGVLALWCGTRAIQSRHPGVAPTVWTRWLLVIGAPFLFMWLRLAAYTTHVDDVIALTALAASGLAIERRRTTMTVVLLSLAAAVKPWALVFAPLAMLGGGRRPLVRPAVVLGVAAATWLPFVVGAPGTIEALRAFALPVDPNSGVRALGQLDAVMPGWVRPTQLGLALLATTFAVVRRRSWPAALVVGVAVRLALDPSTNHYYTTGLVLAGVLWEADRWPGRLPWRTAAVVVVVEAAAYHLDLWGLMPLLRLLVLLGLVLLVLAPARPGTALEGGRAPPKRTRPRDLASPR